MVRDTEGGEARLGMHRGEAPTNGEVKAIGYLARGRERMESRFYDIWFLWNCDAVSQINPNDFVNVWRDRADLM